MDLSNLGQSFAQSGLLDSVSRFVGGSPDATKKTLNAAIPTTMYAIADHGSSELGARGLLDALNSGQAPQLDVNDLGRTLSNPQSTDKLLTESGGFLERTFGSKLTDIVGALSPFGGSDRSATTKLVALAAPLALGVVGRHARENSLDARGLAGFLSSQKSKVASLVPGPLRSLLGAGNGQVAAGARAEAPARAVSEAMPSRAPEPARVAVVSRERPAAHAPRRTPWLWALPILAGLIALGWYVATRRGTPSSPNVAGPTTPARQTPSARPQAQAPKAISSMTRVMNYLASGNTTPQRFTFKELGFATGVSQLSNDGRQVARQLAGALKAHPTATVRLEGYNDAMGTASMNDDLSLRRADAVKQALIQEGIAGDRIELAGNAAGAPDQTAARVDVIVRGGAPQ
jgi:outer membrane protein OmpA-like peptidoglycan-associated protein